MSKQKAFNTERNSLCAMVTKMMGKVLPRVLAEEPTGGADPTPNGDPNPQPQGGADPQATKTPTVNYEDLIANARRQEKEKLYPQIKKLEDDKNALIEKNNNNLLALGEKDSEIASLKKQLKELTEASTKGDSEVVKQLKKQVSDLQKENEDLKANTVSREDVENEIKAEYEVKLYREQQLREAGDHVIPELITGSTKEEIDASIELAKKRYEEISSKVLNGVQAPLNNGGMSALKNEDLKIEDIANLDPRSPEYAQLRAKLGLK